LRVQAGLLDGAANADKKLFFLPFARRFENIIVGANGQRFNGGFAITVCRHDDEGRGRRCDFGNTKKVNAGQLRHLEITQDKVKGIFLDDIFRFARIADALDGVAFLLQEQADRKELCFAVVNDEYGFHDVRG